MLKSKIETSEMSEERVHVIESLATEYKQIISKINNSETIGNEKKQILNIVGSLLLEMSI